VAAIAVSLSILPGLTPEGRPKKSTDGTVAGEQIDIFGSRPPLDLRCDLSSSRR
jgi:hypothetical protein